MFSAVNPMIRAAFGRIGSAASPALRAMSGPTGEYGAQALDITKHPGWQNFASQNPGFAQAFGAPQQSPQVFGGPLGVNETPQSRIDAGFSAVGGMFGGPSGVTQTPAQRVAEGHGMFSQPPGMPLDIKPPQQAQAAPPQMQGPPPPMQGASNGPPGISPMWLQRDRETGEYLDPRMAALAEKQHPGPFAGLFG